MSKPISFKLIEDIRAGKLDITKAIMHYHEYEPIVQEYVLNTYKDIDKVNEYYRYFTTTPNMVWAETVGDYVFTVGTYKTSEISYAYVVDTPCFEGKAMYAWEWSRKTGLRSAVNAAQSLYSSIEQLKKYMTENYVNPLEGL